MKGGRLRILLCDKETLLASRCGGDVVALRGEGEDEESKRRRGGVGGHRSGEGRVGRHRPGGGADGRENLIAQLTISLQLCHQILLLDLFQLLESFSLNTILSQRKGGEGNGEGESGQRS
jgi:hypothetical protein